MKCNLIFRRFLCHFEYLLKSKPNQSTQGGKPFFFWKKTTTLHSFNAFARLLKSYYNVLQPLHRRTMARILLSDFILSHSQFVSIDSQCSFLHLVVVKTDLKLIHWIDQTYRKRRMKKVIKNYLTRMALFCSIFCWSKRHFGALYPAIHPYESTTLAYHIERRSNVDQVMIMKRIRNKWISLD